MPVNATRVTTLFEYGLPGPPQTFAAKTAVIVGAFASKRVIGIHQQRAMRRSSAGRRGRSRKISVWIDSWIRGLKPCPSE